MSRRHLSATAGLVGVALLALAAANPASAAGEPVSRSGVLEVLHEDHLERGVSVHRYRLLDSGGGATELLFDDRGPEGLGARSVRVTGTQVRPGVVRVGSTSAVAETGDSTGGTTAEATAAVTQQKVAVVMYDFLDSPDAVRTDTTAASAEELIFGTTKPSVNGFLKDASFSQLTMVGADGMAGDVFDWVTIPSNSTDNCDFDKWGAEARALAAGFVDSAYTQVIHLMPKSTCGFGGVAYMPGKYSWTVLGGSTAEIAEKRLRGITSHEFGHSLGIHHAGTWACTDRKGNPVTLGTSCTLSEYGDAFSAMGHATRERQYHGYQKGRLNWLSDPTDTLDVTASGTYDLASVSTNNSTSQTPQVLRIARPRTKGQGGDFYYLELRQTAGFFDSFASTDPVTKGVSVRIAPDYGVNAISKLLDTTPGTATFDDAALQPGAVFSDSAMGLTVEVLSVNAETGVASVTVAFGSTTTGGGKPQRNK